MSPGVFAAKLETSWLVANPLIVDAFLVAGVSLSLCCFLLAHNLAIRWLSQPIYLLVVAALFSFLQCVLHPEIMGVLHLLVLLYFLLQVPRQNPGWLVAWVVGLGFLQSPALLRQGYSLGEVGHKVALYLLLALLTATLGSPRWQRGAGSGTAERAGQREGKLPAYPPAQKSAPRGLRPLERFVGGFWLHQYSKEGLLRAVESGLQRGETSYYLLALEKAAWELLLKGRERRSPQVGRIQEEHSCYHQLPVQALVATWSSDCVVLCVAARPQQVKSWVGKMVALLQAAHRLYGDPIRLPLLSSPICSVSYPHDGDSAAVLVAVLLQRLSMQQQQVWEAELERQQRLEKLAAVGQLAAGLAHEIRNPLTSIRGFLQIAAVESLALKRWEAIMLSEMDRINELLKQFLKLSETRPIQFAHFLLDLLMRDVLELLRPKAVLMGHELVAAPPPRAVEVVADAERLKQVLINLVKNGLEALEHPGVVEIGWWEAEDGVRIQVRDHGQGMKPEDLAKVFDPFFTTKREGTGMGLTVCQRIVEDHGGRLEVASHLGRGTTFTVHLPLTQLESDGLAVVGAAHEIVPPVATWAAWGREVQ